MRLFSIVLRHTRRLSTAAPTAAKPLTLTQTKRQLKLARGDPDVALNIYNSFIAGNHPSIAATNAGYTQEHTVRLLAKSHRFSDIETLLESLKSSSHITQEHFLSSIIRSYSSAGMFQNALNTYDQMTELGTPRSVISFNTLLSACVHSKLFDNVITYFDQLPAKFGFSPDKFSYGILIKAYCEIGSPEIAIDKLNEMQGKGCDLDPVAFNTIFHYFYLNGRTKEAEAFWNEVVKEKGYKPDDSAYSVKLNSIKHGDTDGLNRLIEEMNNAGILYNGLTYNTIITFYCENGIMKEAHEAYDQMLKQKGCNPVFGTYKALVIHNCKVGKFLAAYKVFRRSLRGVKVLNFDTLKCMAEGLANEGYKDEAKDLIRTMKKRSPPKLLEAWGKLADTLGLALEETKAGELAPDGTEEVGSDKVEKAVDSSEKINL